MTQPSHPDDVTRARLIPPVPVAVAPMAGGPSTPELVAAVVGAGGGGFLAGGMRTAAQMRAQVDALRALLGDLDLALVPPVGDEGRDIDSWADLREL